MTTATPPVAVPEPTKAKRGFGRRETVGRKPGRGGAGWFVRITVTILCFLWIVPTLGLLITSFRTAEEALRSGWWTVFRSPLDLTQWTIQNYHQILTESNIGRAFLNSFVVSLPATIIPIMIAAFAAYAFTFMEFPFRDTLFLTVVALLVVPNYVAFVPVLKIYGTLGISGFAGVWLAHIGFGMSLAIYILRNYMATLPKTVIESAKIDGASHFQTFYKLVLPMSVPALASFAIFQFLWVWNDLLVALVFIGPGDNAPITVAVKNNLMGQQGAGWNLITAGGFMSMVVPIIVFLALQRFFVRGLTAGAVKG